MICNSGLELLDEGKELVLELPEYSFALDDIAALGVLVATKAREFIALAAVVGWKDSSLSEVGDCWLDAEDVETL